MPCFIDLAPHYQTCREKGPISFKWGILVSCGRDRLLPSQMTFRKVDSWILKIKKIIVCVCVYMCVHACTVLTFVSILLSDIWGFMSSYPWTDAHMEGRARNQMSFLLCLLPQDRISHWTGCLPFWLGWMTKEVGISQSLTYNSRIRHTCSHTWFFFYSRWQGIKLQILCFQAFILTHWANSHSLAVLI